MPSPSIAQVLIYTTAIGGITLFWVEFTVKACVAVSMLANEMFADKVSQDRERRRKIKQEVREEIEIEKVFDDFSAESGAPRGENSGHSPADKTD